MHRTLSHVFRHVDSYATFMPSFWATWGFVVASDSVRVAALGADQVDGVLQARGIKPALTHYDGQTHRHVFALPKAVRAILASAVAPSA